MYWCFQTRFCRTKLLAAATGQVRLPSIFGYIGSHGKCMERYVFIEFKRVLYDGKNWRHYAKYQQGDSNVCVPSWARTPWWFVISREKRRSAILTSDRLWMICRRMLLPSPPNWMEWDPPTSSTVLHTYTSTVLHTYTSTVLHTYTYSLCITSFRIITVLSLLFCIHLIFMCLYDG